MAKAGFKKRRYYFTDKSIALDTVIAFILSGIALLIEISGVVFFCGNKGENPGYICYAVCVRHSTVHSGNYLRPLWTQSTGGWSEFEAPLHIFGCVISDIAYRRNNIWGCRIGK